MLVSLSALLLNLSCSGSRDAAPPGLAAASPPQVVLRIERQGHGDPNVETPRTALTLVLSGAVSAHTPLLEVEGGCSESAGDGGGALVELTCWWAGAGDQLRFAVADGALVVTHAPIGEGMEGEPVFVELERVVLPPDAVVVRADD